MLIGIVAKARNGLLLKFREQHGLTQKSAADLAGIDHVRWNALECMRFKQVTWAVVRAVADLIGVSPEHVCPEVLKNENLGMQRIAYQEHEANKILAARTEQRLCLPSPAHEIADTDEEQSVEERIVELLTQYLTYREREILFMRFGLDGQDPLTLDEAAKCFRVTRERIRQVERKALHKCRVCIPEFAELIPVKD